MRGELTSSFLQILKELITKFFVIVLSKCKS